MSASTSGAPRDGSSPETDSQLVRRATQLCRRAEPHAESVPCPAHLAEAQRQLLNLGG